MLFCQKFYKEYGGVGPESPSRTEEILKVLSPAFVELDKKEAETALSRMHPYYQEFLNKCTQEVREPDLNFSPPLIPTALNAINTSIKAALHKGFAVVRPPGHHAGPSPSGFCYFNNVVIASLFLKGKLAIIDLDAHYGDGTHFLVKDNPKFFYASIHADSTAYYPFKIFSSKNSFLIPVDPKKVNDERFIELVDGLLEEVRRFEPDYLALSMGFDTWYRDPVLPFAIKRASTYEKVGALIRKVGVPFFGVLEGGYSAAIGFLLRSFLKGLGLYKDSLSFPPPKPVLTFTRREGAHYFLNGAGEMVETITSSRIIGKVKKREGFSYKLENNRVMEKKLLRLTFDEFYEKKRTGELAALLREGVEVEIDPSSLPLKEAQKLADQEIVEEVVGQKIVSGEVRNKQGVKEITLHLSNGKRLVIRSGLLVKGAVVEVE